MRAEDGVVSDDTYSGMKPKGDRWKNAHDPAALQRLEHEIDDLRELVRDLSGCLTADARLIATRLLSRGPDVVEPTSIHDHARELVMATTLLGEKRARLHEMRGGT